jgi:hypothetical protein
VAFFDFKDLICTNSVPRGTTVNANYITEAVRRFMKILNEKRPEMAYRDHFFDFPLGQCRYA